MNKAKSLLALVLALALVFPGAALATPDDAPIHLQSNNYGIESMFFGATGTIYSYSASIPPVITSGPTVTSCSLSTRAIADRTDDANAVAGPALGRTSM